MDNPSTNFVKFCIDYITRHLIAFAPKIEIYVYFRHESPLICSTKPTQYTDMYLGNFIKMDLERKMFSLRDTAWYTLTSLPQEYVKAITDTNIGTTLPTNSAFYLLIRVERDMCCEPELRGGGFWVISP